MPNYQNGKIYQIVGAGKVYVGSTTKELQIRLSEHKTDFKRWEKGMCRKCCASYECLTDSDCKIELLEACPCNSKLELERCERQWIQTLDCVNKYLPAQTHEHRLKQNKDWRASNRENLAQWRKANRERLAQ